MIKILILSFIAALLFSCTDEKAQEKVLLNEVIKEHDKVMAADEQLMKNKMLLDSTAKFKLTGDKKDSVDKQLGDLNSADSVMGDWMHKFNPDLTGKSHEECMMYLIAQKKQITKIDSQLNAAVNQSNNYLLKIKIN